MPTPDVAELRVALEAWISLRDRSLLEKFHAVYYAAWPRDEASATIAGVPEWFAPLVEHAASVDVEPAAVRRRVAIALDFDGMQNARRSAHN